MVCTFAVLDSPRSDSGTVHALDNDAAFELTMAHPDREVDIATACLMLGGPALYFVGLSLFEVEISRASVVPPLIAIAALAALIPIAGRHDEPRPARGDDGGHHRRLALPHDGASHRVRGVLRYA